MPEKDIANEKIDRTGAILMQMLPTETIPTTVDVNDGYPSVKLKQQCFNSKDGSAFKS